jgi:fructose-1,6-bisphosphatase I
MSVDQAVGTAPVLACVLERWSVDRYGTWALVVTLDPANGAAGVHANAPVGTVFGVLPAIGSTTDLTAAVLQPGRHQLAAGVIVYEPCTTLSLTLGDGTEIYILDPRSRTSWTPGHANSGWSAAEPASSASTRTPATRLPTPGQGRLC